MAKAILEVELKVSGVTHHKKTKEGEKAYNYGALTIHNPELYKFVGKKVKVKIVESES